MIRTVHAEHGSGHRVGGLLHYVEASSNRVSRVYRKGVRGKELYGAGVHHTGVYSSRFADYIIRDVRGSHKAWRTHQLADPHVRAPHYHNPVAQTDRFELAFDHASKRWNGAPAIHVGVYGRGRPGQPWIAFRVPPYMVERLTEPGVKPKTVRIGRDKICVTYVKEVPDRRPVSWAGVDMNAKNNTYAYVNGMTSVVYNRGQKEYNRACLKVLRVKRRNDARIMGNCTKKAWRTYFNRINDHIKKEAKAFASGGCGLGYEILTIDRLYTKGSKMAPFTRGRLKTALNVGRRRDAMVNAQEAAGLPHGGVDPVDTSAKCNGCGKKLKPSTVRQNNARNMWCQQCRSIRERDCNAAANVLFRTVMALVMECTGDSGSVRGAALPYVISRLRGALAVPHMNARQRSILSDILRLLEGRRAGAEWRLPGAHKPGRQNSASGDLAGGPGVDGVGRNGPGPPNAAKLCNYA